MTQQTSTFSEKGLVNVVAGALAGALTATVVCPLDVLKTRIQLQAFENVKNFSIKNGLSSIVKADGFSGLYRGLSPTLVALLPNWGVYFYTYEHLKKTLSSGKLKSADDSKAALHMVSAAGAGVSTLLITNPFWVVKTRIQSQGLPVSLNSKQILQREPYTTTFNALLRISREEGLRGLYSGLAPSMFGVLHVAIQFPLYEFLKSHVATLNKKDATELNPVELICTSAISKAVASSVTYPHEVVRSYMHVAGSGPLDGLVDTVRSLYREAGVRAFYRGCATNLLRTTPAAAVTFTSFELMVRCLSNFPRPSSLRETQESDEQEKLDLAPGATYVSREILFDQHVKACAAACALIMEE